MVTQKKELVALLGCNKEDFTEMMLLLGLQRYIEIFQVGKDRYGTLCNVYSMHQGMGELTVVH